MTSNLRRAYFRWLYNKVTNPKKSYRKLAGYLDTQPFYWSVPNDGNREMDCIREREIFLAEESFFVDNYSEQQEYFMKEPVTVFEVMAVLASRLYFQMDGLGEPKEMYDWFEELLKNIELDYLIDSRFYNNQLIYEEIDEILDTLLDRSYDKSGNGSFFPLKRKTKLSMPTTEIWYQMMAYLDERY